ncbi:hypothetical protein An06g02300 [Aspergillus niger]|uniref:Uncharacterized protein n=2 Tax=Aspergillus niger TaxID=5061 RepID=A2QLS9_ASPNC|nr:hypothetical protein An06g02300 [Aspergillus niger]CAK48074.1 hypothetical protein An06g02300 [Aspergillus niger]
MRRSLITSCNPLRNMVFLVLARTPHFRRLQRADYDDNLEYLSIYEYCYLFTTNILRSMLTCIPNEQKLIA